MNSSEKSLIDANPEPLRMDLEFYDDIRARAPERKLLQRSRIEPNNGKGFRVAKGQTFKIIQEEGPQVVDVCLWNAHSPKQESLSLNRTLLVDGLFITTNSRLWSDLPMYRPIATCIEDTVRTGPADEGWHAHFSGSSLRFRGLGADVRRARFKRMSPQSSAGRGIYGPYRGRRNR